MLVSGMSRCNCHIDGRKQKKDKVSKKKLLQKCPCCKQPRRLSECRIFSNQVRALIGNYPNKLHVSDLELLGNYSGSRAHEESVQWACDECIESKRAITGEPRKQLFLDYPPYFAYFDQEKVCRVCQQIFVFEKGEQQHWYEHLRFWVQATRVYCKDCQSEKRQLDRLSQLLYNFQYTDWEPLKEIVGIYLQRKEYDKAKNHLSMSKKHWPKDSSQYHELDQWNIQIKELEKKGA